MSGTGRPGRGTGGKFVRAVKPVAGEVEDHGGDDYVDPGAATADAGPAEPAVSRTGRRQRSDKGIPRGSHTTGAGAGAKTAKTAKLDLSAFTGLFVGFHAALAQAADCPPLAISAEQGEEYLTTVQRVLSHYSLESTQKTLDIAALVGATATMYGPAAFWLFSRRGQRREEPDNPNVVQHPTVYGVPVGVVN